MRGGGTTAGGGGAGGAAGAGAALRTTTRGGAGRTFSRAVSMAAGCDARTPLGRPSCERVELQNPKKTPPPWIARPSARSDPSANSIRHCWES
jgi:hypothetical protein